PSPYVTHDPMLGRPNWAVPVFMNILAGAWLGTSVATVLMKHNSSATRAVCGRHSLTHAPLCPRCAKRRVVPSSFGGSFAKVSIKAKRLPSRYDGGIGCPLYFCSAGL